MGLFSNRHRLNNEHLKKLVGVANEAWHFFPGSLDGAKLSFQNADINLLDQEDRISFGQALLQVLESMDTDAPLAPQWMAMHRALPADADRFAIASIMVAKSMMWIDMIAEAELQFPRDDRIRRLRLELMNGIFLTLERYYGTDIFVFAIPRLPHLEKVVMGPLAGDWTKDPD